MRRIAMLVGVTLALGVAPGAALADDASLRAAVAKQQQPTLKALKAFERAGRLGERPSEAKIRRLHRATLRLSNVFARYVDAVGEEEASSPQLGKAQKALLSGLRRMRAGLGTFDRALVQWLNGASERTVKRTIESSLKKFQQAKRAVGDSLDVILPDEEGTAAVVK